jgi:hypothetical protein
VVDGINQAYFMCISAQSCEPIYDVPQKMCVTLNASTVGDKNKLSLVFIAAGAQQRASCF